jgi:hypothetical protein
MMTDCVVNVPSPDRWEGKLSNVWHINRKESSAFREVREIPFRARQVCRSGADASESVRAPRVKECPVQWAIYPVVGTTTDSRQESTSAGAFAAFRKELTSKLLVVDGILEMQRFYVGYALRNIFNICPFRSQKGLRMGNRLL